GSYLRGQVFLVLLVSLVLFIALSILGVKFALILAIFSGLAEIVPIIGPIVAASLAAIVAFIGGTSNFSLAPLQTAIAVVVIYTVVRQLQDYLVNPYIMGKITKLHPLVILFAVLAGEHTAGILGLILAVPIAGVLRIFLEFSLDKINGKTENKKFFGRQ
ncbi:MAG: AI-2E family transporter, partial [Patescibacteria group bacterium]|nr:AI-2E family transporter [Patescibacteria group bacterium]